MIIALLRYYWQVLKYGKPQPRKEIDPVYGRKELQKNQIWYGMTALAIVGGLAIYVPVLILSSYAEERESRWGCGWPANPYEYPEPIPAPEGPISQGTKVRLLNFQIPAPEVRREIRMDGIANEQYILDLKSLPSIIDIEEDYIIPELDTLKEVLDYQVPVSFDFPLIYGEEVNFCCMCFPWERDYGIGDPPYFLDGLFQKVDSEPEPVNLKEVLKGLRYPQLARDAGMSGTVVLRVGVDKYGNYTSHKVIKEVHPILLEEVEKEVSKLHFVPAIWKGEPIPFAMNIPFRFELKN
ncbi:MAG: energy transducer TonB [Bacteroidota bacterium]